MTTSSTPFTARFRVLYQPEATDSGSGSDVFPTVYWFNHAGGTTNTLAFRVRSDPPPRPMRLLTPRLPEREDDLDMTFEGDLEQLAQKFANQIAEDYHSTERENSPPVVIVGHSYGGAVAYRVTKHLTRLGISPHRLVICSTRSP
ncbi:alpha/beta fold hydrolase, partial [Novipirellula maiorica]|uniref:alpha/beta fold hydrolase n=1 Tax=Novipirellula maiorica TaxID=1265734 RepID=UPI000594BAAE